MQDDFAASIVCISAPPPLGRRFRYVCAESAAWGLQECAIVHLHWVQR